MKNTVIGIDVGTSGVRAVVAGPEGNVWAEADAPLAPGFRQGGAHEQDPEDWWRRLSEVCRSVAAACPAPVGVCITSTSGTLVLAREDGRPARPAILYDDGRSGEEGAEAGVNASYSLAKAIWVCRHEPAVWGTARRVLHPADWLAGRLTGDYGVADPSNVLKLGYDAACSAWSDVTLREIGRERLPRVVLSGTVIGAVSAAAAQETGIAAGTPVFAGATDGMAALIASGASRAGDANTTLGTTLVWKALCCAPPRAAHGIYSHLHPTGLWAPGAASNTGPGILERASTDEMAAPHIDTAAPGYFLSGEGERFPFHSPRAVTFFDGGECTAAGLRAAQLASLAFAERWGYELLCECGVESGGDVFSTGGAARSAIFGALRASVLSRRVIVVRHPTSAFGAAILAAAGAWFAGNTGDAIRSMTAPCASFDPDPGLSARYEEMYRRFRGACARRGYGE